jgi:kinesin family protein 3/17
MELKEDPDKGVFVKDLTAVVVKDYDEIDEVMKLGTSHRSVGATAMNADSSRSHSLFPVPPPPPPPQFSMPPSL